VCGNDIEHEGGSTMTRSDIDRLQGAVARTLHDHWVLFVVEGVVLLILGVLAIIAPVIATLFFAIFLGWMFLISGVVGLITTFMMRQLPGFWWSLLSALIAVGAGVILIGWPVSGAVSLTLVLIVFFVVEGVASVMYALEHRRELSGRWGFMLVSGIIDLILAAIILSGLPETALWVLGLLVGINMVFGGTALIAMGLHARGLGPGSAPRPA
jgi:uncharacterized membrane protein HdeD (DUF308 family)